MELKSPKLKFPTTTEMAKEVAEKALDEYEYEGKTIRQWVEVLKDYDDKKTTLERIVKRLEKELEYSTKNFKYDEIMYRKGIRFAKNFITEEGLN